jgi:hypothetical protein
MRTEGVVAVGDAAPGCCPAGTCGVWEHPAARRSAMTIRMKKNVLFWNMMKHPVIKLDDDKIIDIILPKMQILTGTDYSPCY